MKFISVQDSWTIKVSTYLRALATLEIHITKQKKLSSVSSHDPPSLSLSLSSFMNWLAMFIEGEVAKSWDSKPHLDSWVQNPQLPKAFITSRPVLDHQPLSQLETYWIWILSSASMNIDRIQFVFLPLGIQFFMM